MKKITIAILVFILTSIACSATNSALESVQDTVKDQIKDAAGDLIPDDLLNQIPEDLLEQIPDMLTQMPDDFLEQIPLMMTEAAPQVPTQEPVSVVQQTGSISGQLSYPSEMIPAMTVVARNFDDPNLFFVVYTVDHQGDFLFENVPPGTYTVIAYASIGADIAGAYSEAVPCGLLYSCTDHSLIPVMVVSGQETMDITPWDWYAPEGTFPPNPVP